MRATITSLNACKEGLLIAKLRPRFWLARMFVTLEILAVSMVAWFEADSLTAKAIESAGKPAWMLIVALAFCCLVALADVLVNDLLPGQFRFIRGLAHRHLGYMGMALLLAVIDALFFWQEQDDEVNAIAGEVVRSHCRRAYYKEVLRRSLPPEYREIK